jgi:hypothetical protein
LTDIDDPLHAEQKVAELRRANLVPLERLKYLVALEEDWNSERGNPRTEETVVAAVGVLGSVTWS